MDQQEFQSQVLAFIANTEQKFARIDEHFTRIDDRFTKIDDRLEAMQGDINGLKQHGQHMDRRMDHLVDSVDMLNRQHIELARKTDEIYQSRNTVKIKFGWEWSAVSFTIALLASGISSGMTKFIWR